MADPMEIEQSKYILYLHPAKDTLPRKQLEKLWESSPTVLSQNFALEYPLHSTVTGFFTTDDPEAVAKKAKLIYSSLNTKTIKNFELIDRGGLKVVGYHSTSLVTKTKSLLKAFSFLRSPSIDGLHFTLTNGILENENDKALKMISETIDLSQWYGAEWNLILWEICCDNWSVYEIIY